MDVATSSTSTVTRVVLGYPDKYRSEIDGLRTIAVVSVFAFHLNPKLLGGGFVGVDIFFVISGYLITGLLIKDFENGKSILRFYQRRIARIAPAAFLVIAITMATAFFLYSCQDFASVGDMGFAATLSIINFQLRHQVSYFEISQDAQPLIHYWSLAIEEQFYLGFPILLYFLMPMKRQLLTIVVACCALSFVVCVVVTSFRPIAAFYLLPSRAWELLAGSSLAIAQKKYPWHTYKQLPFGLPIGLIIVLLSFVFVREEGFPGWIAVLPVVGSTLILTGVGADQGPAQRFLAHPLMVFIGKRSYSLYLWHWPTFSFVDYYFYVSNSPFRLCLKVFITIGGTLLTYHFVERPMREWLNIPSHRVKAFGAFGVAAMLLAFVGYNVRSNYYLNAEPSDVARGGISVNPGGRGWIVLIGDSQGSMYGFDLASLARKLDFRLNVLSSAAENELPGEPGTLWPSVLQFLGDRKPDAIILVEAWTNVLGRVDEEHFKNALSALVARAGYLFVLSQPPMAPPDATRQAMRAGARPPFFEHPAATEHRLRATMIIRKFENNRIQVVDVAPYFLNADNSVKVIASDGRLAFHDQVHLSDSGTALLRPTFERLLREVLPPPHS
jgi:peptidoglycan/LPS O-acetylase OafA/YrhL